mgnify:CR=1|jgi:hypothetical protein
MRKHNHNIDLYESLRNEGCSWAEISEKVKIPETSIITWLKNNYKEVVRYSYIKK